VEIIEAESNVVEVKEMFKAKIETNTVADDEFIEEFVDEEYKRTIPLTPKCLEFQRRFLLHFGKRKTPIPFKEIAEWSESVGWSYYVTVTWMRMLWKAGLVRRWYKGLWNNAVKGNVTGLKWGVHYLPKE
jgi:hypothetical protein